MGRGLRLALVTAGVFVAGGTVAWATGFAPHWIGGDGSIAACVQNDTGDLRLIDPSSRDRGIDTCRRDETRISFDQHGQRGDPGPPGPQGPPGTLPGPASVTVDCSTGGSIDAALANTASAPSVQITVNGTCTEAVFVARDDVTLQAASPGDGIQSPNGNAPALTLDGAARVHLSGLALTGGGNTFVVQDGSSFDAVNLSVTGANHDGVFVAEGSNGTMRGGTVAHNALWGAEADGGSLGLFTGLVVESNGSVGAVADHGGNLFVNGATVQGNGGGGLQAFTAGTIGVSGSGTAIQNNSGHGLQVDGDSHADVDSGATITANSGGGIIVFSSSSLHLQGAAVSGNSGDGVSVDIGSSAAIQSSTISQNTGNGVSLGDTSVVQFDFPSGNNQITNNGGWGVFCDGPPSVALTRGGPGTVTENGAGQAGC